MVRYIDLLKTIKDKLNMLQIENKNIKKEIKLISNELMLDILHDDKSLPFINNIEKIKVLNYCYIYEYITQGYFIYKDYQDNQIVAINNLSSIEKTILESKNLVLIKKKDFYKVLENNFAHLNIVKAKYFLEFNIKTVIAKNINYSCKIIVYFIFFLQYLFIVLLYFMFLIILVSFCKIF